MTTHRPAPPGFFQGERRMARLVNYRGRWYWLGTAGWTLWFVAPLSTGWLVGHAFGQLDPDLDLRFPVGAERVRLHVGLPVARLGTGRCGRENGATRLFGNWHEGLRSFLTLPN